MYSPAGHAGCGGLDGCGMPPEGPPGAMGGHLQMSASAGYLPSPDGHQQQMAMSPGPSVAQPPMPQFLPEELEYYESLFGYVDVEKQGFVDAARAGQFLLGSGLMQQSLAMIWDIASQGQNALGRESFFVALRLVAHAQAGREPDMNLVMMQPPSLPDFEGVQRRRPGSGATSRAPSVGAPSEVSELQPVIIAGDDQVRKAAELARQAAPSRSPRGRSLSPRGSPWIPSDRQKRKYAALFKRTDLNGDGYVEGMEARELLQRSNLDFETLKVAWDLSDRDHDGRLDFHEFVILVHIVSCVLQGSPIPDRRMGLPQELQHAVATLEPLEVLAAQREASRSRSHSPIASGHASPAFLATPMPGEAIPPFSEPRSSPKHAPSEPMGLSDAFAPFGSDGAFGGAGAFGTGGLGDATFDGGKNFGTDSAWGTSGFSDQKSSPVSGGFNTDATGFGDFGDDHKKHKKSKRDRSHERHHDVDHVSSAVSHSSPEQAGASSGWVGFAEGSRPADTLASSPSASRREPLRGYDDFVPVSSPSLRGRGRSGEPDDLAMSQPLPTPEKTADQELQRDITERLGAHARRQDADERQKKREELGHVLADFESVVAADRAVARQMEREVVDLEEELRHVNEARQQLERQVQQERRDAERTTDERSKLEQQMADSRRKLADMREDRRALNLESISLGRDRAHFSEELSFLRRLAGDEAKSLEIILAANQLLERSCQDLEVHTAQLEVQRKELAQAVIAEKELLRQNERQNAELRNRLERARREHAAFLAERREASKREMTLRTMQSHYDNLPRQYQLQMPPQGVHSWAHSVTAEPPARKASSQPMVGPMGAIGQRAREGV
eukprot:TRINITY_DN50824_c0_g1_i1.p1 TRINITY_DN50824_c0_g1~~TRINITY_DN50824_c0_g1_i1.p1  ORF type:complete len:845 (+),score=163.50 TRINITY_DN50824_c0_g1_i1:64-2598(+)